VLPLLRPRETNSRQIQHQGARPPAVDTFAQRRREIASGLLVFEIDQPGPQTWKLQRLIELSFGIPECHGRAARKARATANIMPGKIAVPT
jgi:hypothetical protein